MNNIVFVGDSIFDNKYYVEGSYSHIEWAEKLFPPEWKSLLLAEDGSVTRQTLIQLNNIPDNTTHIVVSSGGNDGIISLNEFLPLIKTEAELIEVDSPEELHGEPSDPAEKPDILSSGEITNTLFFNVVSHMPSEVFTLVSIHQKFMDDYALLCKKLEDTHLTVIVCTIYDSVPGLPAILKSILSLFNDTIVSTASDFGFDILDLRKVCIADHHFARISPIEPSSEGSRQIVRSILALLSDDSCKSGVSRIYPGKQG
jgi:hypothetical protein